MGSYTDYSDNEFAHLIQTCELSPERFTPEAHLRLAWILISLYGREQAELNLHERLLKFMTLVGAKEKYYKTLTITSVKTTMNCPTSRFKK